MGEHRLLCGDARDGGAVQRLMAQETARMVFTDPPYNVKIDGHVGGAGKIKHREFAMASGEMSQDQFIRFLTEVLGNMADASCDGSIHFVCMDWRHMSEVMTAGGKAYDELKNLVVWTKSNGGMGTFYRSRHELIFVFKKGTSAHINTFRLGETGRYRTNVWEYPGVNTFRNDRGDELAMHPTVKPVALVADAIKDVSRRGHIVLDAFGGSGTTLIAAERPGAKPGCSSWTRPIAMSSAADSKPTPASPRSLQNRASLGLKLPIFEPKRRLRRPCLEWHDQKHRNGTARLLAALRGTYRPE